MNLVFLFIVWIVVLEMIKDCLDFEVIGIVIRFLVVL